MDISGTEIIPLARGLVWARLNDPGVLRKCIPGCTFLDPQDDGSLLATSTLKIGPIKATFTGKVRFADIEPLCGYTLIGEGQGGVAGFARGQALVRLEDHPDGTALVYDARADIGGKLAQLGSRLIESTARKLVGEFFGAFSASVREMDAVPHTKTA
jgi:carbon monoxide dehydrogenase subunit G